MLLIVLPLAAAWCTQAAARHRRSAAVVQKSAAEAMVPLTAATLAVVVAATIDGVRSRLGDFLGLVPVYVVFAVAMATVGTVAARAARLGPPAGRAVVFSGVTRNSLVVLPLALALPSGYGIAPSAVVTQTLVELVAMVVLVRAVPRLIPVLATGPAS